jgi:hypothetical protein
MKLNPKYHVFLSHSSSDKPAVEELAVRLRRDGIEPWLDKWNLIPGDPWQPAIEQALADCATCAVFVGLGGFGAWQNEEMRAAIDRRVREANETLAESGRPFRVIPVLLPGAERPERSKLPTFLVTTTWVKFRGSLDDTEAFRRLVCGIQGREPGSTPDQAPFRGECPYRGLEVFGEEHARFFFGREALTEWLINALRPSPSGQENRFLAILGASGSGKSSLARAGLMPALRRSDLDGSSEWPTCVLRPGFDPLESLAVALSSIDEAEPSPIAIQGLLAAFRADERTLHQAVRLALRSAPASRRLVTLVDQFEEIFTICRDDATRKALVDNLLYASSVAGGQTVVLLTMRADFYHKCAAYPALAAAMSEHQVLVGPLTPEELRRSIEQPALLAGCELEPGLIEMLVRHVESRKGALPLLQYALLELWKRRDGRRMTVQAYRAIGELRGALENRANEVFRGFNTDTERELCRKIFLRLTQPGEGTEDTKRRVSFGELISAGTDAEATDEVVQRLADARLVTTEGGERRPEDRYVEVAHEALIQGWSELRKWIDADRAGLRTQRRLTEAAHEWESSGRDPSFLYGGARLAVAREWAEARPAELNPLEVDFLAASLAAARKREADELEAARRLAAEAEARRRAEEERAMEAERREKERVEAAQRIAAAAEARELEQREATKKLTLRSRIILAVMILASSLAIAALVGFYQAHNASQDALSQKKAADDAREKAQQKAELALAKEKEAKREAREARRATAIRLASQAQQNFEAHPQRGLLLAVEAVNVITQAGDPRVPALTQTLQRALESLGGQGLGGHLDNIMSSAVSPDGRWLVLTSRDRTASLWDLRADNIVGSRVMLGPHEGPVKSALFSSDSRWLVTRGRNPEDRGKPGDARLWDLSDHGSSREGMSPSLDAHGGETG